MSYRVVLTDQVFPNVERERELFGSIGATLDVASGDRDDILEAIVDADAILTTYFPIDRQAIERLRRCRIIARYGIGVDSIDLVAAAERGITVTNVPDYCIEEVGTHTLALILALLRRLEKASALVRSGAWGIEGLVPIRRLSTLTVGVVGTGRIGSWVIGALKPFVAEVLAYDPYLTEAPANAHFVQLDELLIRSDIVSLHCPLTESTHGLIGTDELKKMKASAILVNTSRGPLVQYGALSAALEHGTIAHAALDVFETEPPAGVSTQVPNLLVTPHMAFYSEEALAESQVKAATQIVKVLTGESADYVVC